MVYWRWMNGVSKQQLSHMIELYNVELCFDGKGYRKVNIQCREPWDAFLPKNPLRLLESFSLFSICKKPQFLWPSAAKRLKVKRKVRDGSTFIYLCLMCGLQGHVWLSADVLLQDHLMLSRIHQILWRAPPLAIRPCPQPGSGNSQVVAAMASATVCIKMASSSWTYMLESVIALEGVWDVHCPANHICSLHLQMMVIVLHLDSNVLGCHV